MLRFSIPSISLAAKCRLLFGLAVAMIIGAALMVPWLRMTDLVHARNFQVARQMAVVAANRVRQTHGGWAYRQRAFAQWWQANSDLIGLPPRLPELIEVDPFKLNAPIGAPVVVKKAIEKLSQRIGEKELLNVTVDRNGQQVYELVRAIRSIGEEYPAGTLIGVVFVRYMPPNSATDMVENLGLIWMAGGLAGILAVLVFYIVTQRLILSPVRELRAVAEQVAGGNHHIRSGIETGDEFEDLARAFNSMLAHLEQQQQELITINRSLDTRLGELAETNVSLFESNQLKSQFVANVSHELRTPLTSIIGFAELLREGTSDAERAARYLQNILDSGRMLLEIINDLLDLAKIEAGKFTLHRGPVNLRTMTSNLLDFFQPIADKKQLQMVTEVASDLPVIQSDSGRIQQVLYNLVSNALKFSPPGGRVTINVSVAGDERVMVRVIDTGIGIPADLLPHIFEKFRQLDGSKTREFGGTGLGLAIARELVHILGGELQVKSDEGKGAEFYFTLPVELVEVGGDSPKITLN